METGELSAAFETFKETLISYGCQQIAMAYVLPGGAIKLEFRSKQTNTEGTFVIEQYENTASFLLIFNGRPLIDKMTIPHTLTIEQINERIDSICRNMQTLIM